MIAAPSFTAYTMPSLAFPDGKCELVQLLTVTGVTATRAEARRLILSNGATVNDIIVTDIDRMITANDLFMGAIVIGAGRWRKVVITEQPIEDDLAKLDQIEVKLTRGEAEFIAEMTTDYTPVKGESETLYQNRRRMKGRLLAVLRTALAS